MQYSVLMLMLGYAAEESDGVLSSNYRMLILGVRERLFRIRDPDLVQLAQEGFLFSK